MGPSFQAKCGRARREDRPPALPDPARALSPGCDRRRAQGDRTLIDSRTGPTCEYCPGAGPDQRGRTALRGARRDPPPGRENALSLHAFTDESKERGFRFVTAVVAARDVAAARADMRDWLIGRRERYHAKNETPDTNKRHLRELGERGHRLSFVVIEHSETRPPRLAREASLARLAAWIVENDVSRWVLERDAPAERSDRRVLSAFQRATPGADFEYLHLAPSAEPLLWASDLVAWSLNRGSVHARIARGLIGELIEVG